MEFKQSDAIQLDNIIKIVRRGNYTLEGLEVLAMADAMKWLSNLQTSMKTEMLQAEAKAKHDAEQRLEAEKKAAEKAAAKEAKKSSKSVESEKK